jgi:hypothetical protein
VLSDHEVVLLLGVDNAGLNNDRFVTDSVRRERSAPQSAATVDQLSDLEIERVHDSLDCDPSDVLAAPPIGVAASSRERA